MTSSKKEVVSIEFPLLMGFSEETLITGCEYDVAIDVVTILYDAEVIFKLLVVYTFDVVFLLLCEAVIDTGVTVNILLVAGTFVGNVL